MHYCTDTSQIKSSQSLKAHNIEGSMWDGVCFISSNPPRALSQELFLAQPRKWPTTQSKYTPQYRLWLGFIMYKHSLDNADLDHSSKRQRHLDRPLPDEQVVAKHRLETQPHSEEVLCDGCRAVDWSSVPALAADGLLKTKKLNLRSWKATFEELRDSSCPICAIVSIIAKPYLGPNYLVLRAIPLTSSFHIGSDAFRYKHPTPDSASRCTVLSLIRPSGYLGPHFETSLAAVRLDDLQSKKITPSPIDYEQLKNLVETCQKEHKRCCKAKSRTNVSGLEVIDVRTQPLQVIEAPGQCEYLALSYVWGKQGESLVHNLENAPAVIKDAISVTKSMGYEYLWVDRYVSNQSKTPGEVIS